MPLALPLSWAYRAGMELHAAIRRRVHQRLDIPVISVGNLSVGGTGKTPMVLHLVRALVTTGRRPCVAMRGYASRADMGSDEATLYTRAFERLGLDVPVVARPDRAVGVRQLVAHRPEIDTVVLDDGFQHRRLHRDLDIVLIDATRSPFQDRLLPAGWLREPVSALRRAGAVVVTHAEAVSPETLATIDRRLETVRGEPAVAIASHGWAGLELTGANAAGTAPIAAGHAGQLQPVDWLRGRRVLVVCAIGNPEAFVREAARQIGQEPTAVIALRDHDPYAPTTVEGVLTAARGMDAVLTTEKDWTKLARVDPARWPCPVARPKLELLIQRGEQELMTRVLGVFEHGT